MRLIDADALFDSAFKVWGGEADAGGTNLFMEMINNAPTIASSPNDPMTLEELREMARKQAPVWCNNLDGLQAGLLCIREEFDTSERMPHIWLLDEEGHSGIYSVQKLMQARATFYRRKPEEGQV